MEYKKVKLGSLIKQVRGISYKKDEIFEEYRVGTIPLLRANNILGEGKLKFTPLLYVKEEKVKEVQLILKGDIVIAASSGSVSIVGKSGQANNNLYKTFGAFCKLIRNNSKEILSSRYLGHFFNSPYYKRTIRHVAEGANINNLRIEHINSLQIPLPPKPIQIKIANALDKAQELIDNRKAQIEKYDELLQSVFLDMFGDPVTNPKGWEVKTVEKVCDKIFGGGTPSKSNLDYYKGEIPWVTPKDMKRLYIFNSIDHINEEAVNNSSTKIIPINSLLMVVRSGILKKKLPLAINKKEVTLNQDMKGFVVDQNIIKVQYLLYFFLESQKYLLSKVRAVTADNIEFKQIKEMRIPLPPLHLQNQFTSIVEKVEEEKKNLEKSLVELENNFNSIMQRAFKGKLF